MFHQCHIVWSKCVFCLLLFIPFLYKQPHTTKGREQQWKFLLVAWSFTRGTPQSSNQIHSSEFQHRLGNFQNTFLESEDCLEIQQWEITFFAARWKFLVKLLHKFDWWGLNLRVGKTYPDTGYIARLPNHKTTNPWASVLQKMKDIVSALTALLINATNHIYHNQKIVQCQSLLLSIHIKVFQIYWGSIWICW